MRFNNYSMVTLGLFTLSTMLSQGCTPAEPEVASISKAEITPNGLTMNGLTMNGLTMNGLTMNGLTMNGLTMNGLTMNGLTMNGLTMNGLALEGSRFRANLGANQVFGVGFIGALIQMTSQPVANQPPISYTLRFDNIYVDPQRPNGDVYLYDISYALAGQSTWNNVCTDTAGNPVAAVPILNYWNTQTGARIDHANVVTFACVSGALGKCVRFGYRPWAQATSCVNNQCSTVALKDYHQACTRMIRADYCGNGTSYTYNGTLIELYDALSPQVQSRTQAWPIEGKWNPTGAYCIGDARHPDLLQRGMLPDCNRDGRPDGFVKCGSSYDLKNWALLGSTFSAGN